MILLDANLLIYSAACCPARCVPNLSNTTIPWPKVAAAPNPARRRNGRPSI
jgi:hypothetical protein